MRYKERIEREKTKRYKERIEREKTKRDIKRELKASVSKYLIS